MQRWKLVLWHKVKPRPEPMLHSLPFHIPALHTAFADGVSPVAVVREAYRRIAAWNDPGIFLHLIDEAEACAEAKKLGAFDPAERPLYGIPFVVKDNIDAAGCPTTAACAATSRMADEDAVAVARLREAGAILLGKTNLDQFATGLVGMRTPFGAPRNALDPAIVPGGSSSGSAVAVAAGFATFSLGTDTAGSGRVPAALNGIVGLKPTLGAISATGLVPACRTLDTISIFALTVDDAYAAYRAAAALDLADAYSREVATPPLAPLPEAFTIGVPDAASREFFDDTAQADAFKAALADLAALGATIREMDFTPFFDVAAMLYDGPWVAERYAVIETLLETDPDAVLPVTRAIIEKADEFSAADAFRAFYRLKDLRRKTTPLLASLDALCVPTIPTFCSRADLEAEPIDANARMGVYTNFVNLLDMCGIAVPTAPRADGRPGNVTVLADTGRDAWIASIARALQERTAADLGATGWPLPALADLATARPDPADEEIAVAAVGAHMSGLPLNHELTSLGARFLYAAKTAPSYRFFSLAGGPPYRPGLVRVAEGGGAIALEVWAVPRARFGDFMAGIPGPLGIGTLTLDDGRQVKGFLCEAIGTDGATEITDLGGWRPYMQSLANSQ